MGAESGGDEIAEEARRLIKERQFSPQRFLAEIDKGWYTDVELCDLPAVQRALLVPALRAMLPDRSGISGSISREHCLSSATTWVGKRSTNA
jgi:hypothetical protein